MRSIIMAGALLCGISCQHTDNADLHGVIKEQRGQIGRLELALEVLGHRAAACDTLQGQVERADAEVIQWKEIAENCINGILEVKVR